VGKGKKLYRALNFIHRNLIRHRAVSLRQHGFLVLFTREPVWLGGAEKKEKPTLTPLNDVECSEQEDIRFETTVAGKPEPTVEWYEFTTILLTFT